MNRISPKPLKQYPWYLRLFYSFQKKKYGEPLLPTLIWGRHPKLLRLFLGMGRYFERKSSLLSPKLRALVMLKVSEMNQCPFCIDLNTFALEKQCKKPLEELSEKEKCALSYAELITNSQSIVLDAFFEQLRSFFSEDAIVELTALISFQNLSSKFNRALEIEPHGFCKKSGS